MEQPNYPGAPRWAKWLGVLSLVAMAAFVILHLMGHGFGHAGMHGVEHHP